MKPPRSRAGRLLRGQRRLSLASFWEREGVTTDSPKSKHTYNNIHNNTQNASATTSMPKCSLNGTNFKQTLAAFGESLTKYKPVSLPLRPSLYCSFLLLIRLFVFVSWSFPLLLVQHRIVCCMIEVFSSGFRVWGSGFRVQGSGFTLSSTVSSLLHDRAQSTKAA